MEATAQAPLAGRAGAADGLTAGVIWAVRPGAEAAFDAWRLAGPGDTVKHNPQRTVYRADLGGFSVYCKHCRLTGPRSWLRQLLRPAKAKLEFDNAVSLADLGVSTFEPLAWGVASRHAPADSFLLTRGVDGAVRLDEFLAGRDWTPADRRHVAESLGEFLAKLHAAGVAHDDLHPGNVLAEWRDGPRFYLLDLHDVRPGRPLSRSQRRENLVLLNRWFQARAGRTDRLRFFRSYGADVDPREVERLTHDSNRKLWRSRDGRCLKSNREFLRIESSLVNGRSVRDLGNAILKQLLAEPDMPFRDAGSVTLKDSRSSTVTDWPTPDGRRLIYKRFNVRGRWDGLKNLLRPSPALRSWRAGHMLLARGLPTPRPLAVLHRRGGPSYLLTEKVEGGRDLHEVDRAGDIDSALNRIARVLRRLHESLSHRDLKPGNILLTADGGVWLIDLVGVRSGRPTFRRRCRDLARLWAGLHASPHLGRDSLRAFLNVYFNCDLHGGDAQPFVDHVTRYVGAKLARNRRFGRPVS